MDNSRMTRKKNRLKSIVKAIMVFGVVSFLLAGGVFAYFAVKVANFSHDSPEHISEKRDEVVNPQEDNITILFLGVDDRDGNVNGLTDALILATFNKNDHTVKMTSIPRDSLVDIPGRVNRDKINHAHSFGGLELAIETVENLFDIPVDYYVKLNFTAFIEIIDALGGVEIDVPFTFSEIDSQDRWNAITLYEGLQTLSGEEALAYSRMRMKDPRGDIGRGERQQEVLKAIISQASSVSSITKYGALLDSLENHLTTNLTFTNMISLHSYSNSLQEIESLSLDGNNAMINGIYYYDLVDESLEIVSNKLKAHLEL